MGLKCQPLNFQNSGLGSIFFIPASFTPQYSLSSSTPPSSEGSSYKPAMRHALWGWQMCNSTAVSELQGGQRVISISRIQTQQDQPLASCKILISFTDQKVCSNHICTDRKMLPKQHWRTKTLFQPRDVPEDSWTSFNKNPSSGKPLLWKLSSPTVKFSNIKSKWEQVVIMETVKQF